MFLSQHPYTSLGSLAEQVSYPVDPSNYSQEQLSQALEAVGLGYLPERLGGFSAEGDWAHTLSPGERQRLAFARLLLRRPPFVILDEATSALDLPSEKRVYQQLRALGCIYLSVGHRPTLRAFHEKALLLDGQGGLEPDDSWGVTPEGEKDADL